MVINFFTEDINFTLENPLEIRNWIFEVVKSENFVAGTFNYIFCSDNYLLKLNIEYLAHNTLTDIITFDYSNENIISGDIFISTERVRENSGKFKVPFDQELKRVIIHGILHLCGYEDGTDSEKQNMRMKEDLYLKTFSAESV